MTAEEQQASLLSRTQISNHGFPLAIFWYYEKPYIATTAFNKFMKLLNAAENKQAKNVLGVIVLK